MEICSTKDLIDLLKEIGEPQSGYSRFFRGHSDREWKIEPSIYRLPKKVEGKPQGKAFIENEDNIIRDAIVNSPDDFSEKNSIFSILVKLQHYGYPTRLLDLTTNALVSLYFAVKSFHDDKDGELLIFDIPNEDVKYFDSDTVSVLSALSLRKEKFRIDGSKSFSKIRSMIFKVENVIDKCDKRLSHEDYDRLIEILAKITGNLVNGNTVSFNDTEIAVAYEEINKIIENYNFSDLELAGINEEEQKKYIEVFNAQPDIARLLHDVRKDKPSFLPVIKSKDLERVICVKPKLDNNRIIRQQGCFLLFGINTIKTNQANLDDNWIRRDNGRIIIPKNKKQEILEELKVFGISEKTLFPELESQAREILDRYR